MSIRLPRRALLGAVPALALPLTLLPRAPRAQTPPLRLGVLTDMSGPYAGNTGAGSVLGARLAAEDFMRANPGIRVEVVGADAQNRVDIGLQLARNWFDREGVDAVLDVPTSAIALGLVDLVREKNKVGLITAAAASDLTGGKCGPNHVHWVYDTWAMSHAVATAMVAEGGDTWSFLTADYAFGHAIERDTGGFVTAAGGRVLGAVRHPFPGTTDFSSFLVQAQSSGAKVLGLANAGTDAVNSIKQAAEFGLTRRMRIAAMLFQINDLHALGLQAGQGLFLAEAFYWDLNDATRAFATRYAREMRGAHPGMIHAGGYSAAMHYLKAAASLGVAEARANGAAVVARMKAMPAEDALFGPGRLREDGRKVHAMHLFQVKAPEASKAPWDYLRLVRSIPAEQAFRPMAGAGCALVRA